MQYNTYLRIKYIFLTYFSFIFMRVLSGDRQKETTLVEYTCSTLAVKGLGTPSHFLISHLFFMTIQMIHLYLRDKDNE